MTAKARAKEALKFRWDKIPKQGDYWFTPDEYKAFCDQLCKEQREICAKVYHNAVYTAIDVESKIFNAKTPDL